MYARRLSAAWLSGRGCGHPIRALRDAGQGGRFEREGHPVCCRVATARKCTICNDSPIPRGSGRDNGAMSPPTGQPARSRRAHRRRCDALIAGRGLVLGGAEPHRVGRGWKGSRELGRRFDDPDRPGTFE